MIQAVSSASFTSELYFQQQQANAAANRPKAVQKPEKADSVELSQQARAVAEAEHKRGQH